MIESWVDVDDCVCAATIEDDDGEQLHLSVEPLPDGGWDWTVWRSQVESRYGPRHRAPPRWPLPKRLLRASAMKDGDGSPVGAFAAGFLPAGRGTGHNSPWAS